MPGILHDIIFVGVDSDHDKFSLLRMSRAPINCSVACSGTWLARARMVLSSKSLKPRTGQSHGTNLGPVAGTAPPKRHTGLR